MELPTTLTLCLILLLQTGCGLLGSDPNQPELEPGRRDYTWTVDSVGSTPDRWVGWGNSIWGSAPDDVWLALTGGYENLWHYDGTEWNPFSYRLGPDGFTGDFYTIYGFAHDDVWMAGGAGDGGGIWHFDGSQWKEVYVYDPSGMITATIHDIWGETSTDIYAVGSASESGEMYKGFVLHYDGLRWREVLQSNNEVRFHIVREGKEGTFIRAGGPYEEGIRGRMTIYKLDGGRVRQVVSKIENEVNHLLWVNIIDNSIFLVDGHDLIKYKGRSIFSLDTYIDNEMIFSFFARNTKDVFLSSSAGLMHYNGDNVNTLINKIVQPSSVIFENDVFFLVNDYGNGTNLIYHGTLPPLKPEEE